MTNRIILPFLLASLLPAIAHADDAPHAAADPTAPAATGPLPSDDYTLFNPTPADKLRGMSTERPSKTDSALTVDPGHLQIESSLYSYTHNNDCIDGDCTHAHESSFGQTTNFRIGLTENSDFQVITDLYDDLRIRDVTAGGASDGHTGFGDTTLRYKYSFSGNQGQTWAVAAIPFVKLPTNNDDLGNHDVEWGFAVPFTYNFAKTWSISSEPIVEALHRAERSGYYDAYADSIVLGDNFTDKASGYIEYFAFFPNDGARHWQNSADAGFVYALTDNLHVDTGVNIGATDAANDLNYFVGAAYRF